MGFRWLDDRARSKQAITLIPMQYSNQKQRKTQNNAKHKNTRTTTRSKLHLFNKYNQIYRSYYTSLLHQTTILHQEKMAAKRKQKNTGGLKGFFSKAGKSFYTGGILAKDQSQKLAVTLCRYGFIFATTCIVAFVPLVFEIAREGQVRWTRMERH